MSGSRAVRQREIDRWSGTVSAARRAYGDLDRVAVDGKFTANDVLRAIEGHVLGKASITGTYTLNPRLA